MSGKLRNIQQRDTTMLWWGQGGHQLTVQVAINHIGKMGSSNPEVLDLEVTSLDSGKTVHAPVARESLLKLGEWLVNTLDGDR